MLLPAPPRPRLLVVSSRYAGLPSPPVLESTVSSTPSAVPDGLRPLGSTPPLRDYLAELWERRQFALTSAFGDLRAEHMNTALGNLWHLLNPILLIAVYWLIFDVVLNISRGGLENFLGFLTVGILAYQWSQRTIVEGAKTIVRNEGMIRSLQFPRALLPLATLLKHTISFAPSFVLMLVVILATGEGISVAWLIVIPAFVLQVMFNMGSVLFIARVADRFHDTTNLLPFLFRLAFYGSGVIFAVDTRFSTVFTREWVVWIFIANPFYAMLGLWREGLMTTYEITTHEVHWLWVSASVWAVVGLVVGLQFFRAGEKDYGRG